ncbi:ABC transporter substrate-binding protein [Paenibacillus sp. 481]|uniref:ABC transporter substrate-binding protein n=1 Tax=Paenibacillus sp. 481 TaxID=2835869 RepID=UPI001E2ECEC9|nr:ABC transporter substrate-binding protein [Paenibacillus sp. 481]UHA74291.1 ABC transporter substrate-binding protein [Paenibacillus sp. 481]
MKKKLLMLLSLTMALTLVLSACGGSKSEGDKKDASQSTQTPAESGAAKEELVSEGVIPASNPAAVPDVAKARKDSMILGIGAPSGIFLPTHAESQYDRYVADSMFNYLFEIQKDGSYSEDLAESYTISDDKLTYTFKLKEGLKFSDGTALTAEDVAFSMHVYYDKAYDGPSDIELYAPIKGGVDYKAGKATSISGVKVVDPRTISITTTEQKATALNTLGQLGILSKAYYGKDYKQGSLDFTNFYTNPLGNGRYKLEKFTAGQEAVLVANEHYHGGKPKVNKLIYKFTNKDTNIQLLQTGETDLDDITVSVDAVTQLKDLGFLNVNLYPTNGYGYIAFNHKKDKFKDQKVRQALAYGLNRQEIVDAVFQGYADVIDVPQSKLSWSYTDEVTKYNFDLEKAKQLLEEAGWKVGADGIREKNGEKFKIIFSAAAESEVNDAIIPVAQDNYKQLGIDFVAEVMDFNAVKDKRKKGDFDMAFMAWSLTPDPQVGQNVFGTGGSQNDDGYSNKKVDELFTKAGKEIDPEKRKLIFHELYQELNKDLPYIFMYQRRDMWPISDRLKGFDISPYKDFTFDLQTITIQ